MAELHDYLRAFAERGPLVLVLEDLHWADPESLEFLRVFARHCTIVALLLVATYRDDDLTHNPALYHLLPHLVRESKAQRIGLHRSTYRPSRRWSSALCLAGADLARLAAYLGERGQGVPLYLLELLRALEEEQRLRHGEPWLDARGDRALAVPLLVRQVIDGRIARLGADIRRLLELGAVIGQDVPLLFWRRVSGASADAVRRSDRARPGNACAGRSIRWGCTLRFTHALVRDALYAGIVAAQRRRPGTGRSPKPWQRRQQSNRRRSRITSARRWTRAQLTGSSAPAAAWSGSPG